MSRRSEPFGAIVRRFMREGFFPGAVLRVEREGRVLHEEAWGYAILAEGERIPVTPSTLFDLASVSKLFTATAVLRLVTLGALRLDAKVADLPGTIGLESEGPGKSLGARLAASLGNVDVASLLTHASGLHYWHPFYAHPAGAAERSPAPFPAVLADVLEMHPRKNEVIYSDLNFMLLGRIIESILHVELPAAIQSLVFTPLGLDRSSYVRPLGPVAATEHGNRIEKGMVSDLGFTFEGWRDESRPIVGEANDGNCFYYFRGAAGHAGVFSDARDLCRLGRLYLDVGGIGAAAYLSPGLAEEAMRDHGSGRGLGFQLGEDHPSGLCGHTGFTGTSLTLSRSGIVIALLTNRLHVPQPRDIGPFRREILAAVLSAFA
jgi:serine-type D-Ala-D-Ala carboxypeptidase